MRLIQKAEQHFNMWALLSLVFIFIILIPNLLIGFNLFTEPTENWAHIKEYLLKDYIYNSVVLIIFTAMLTMIIGTSLAWIIINYRFPLRNFFKWGLILPLAIPAYIGAYTYQGILNYSGTIQSTLRNTFDIHVTSQKLFNIMNIPGAIFIFTIFLYPYVYVITKGFLENQSSSMFENARLLGGGPFTIFFRAGLPLSRAAITGGVVLVILEVLNDYGVVSYFGIQTFSTAIFRTWYGMKDLDSALKLAGILMFIVIIVLVLERIIRGRKSYGYSSANFRPIEAQPLKGTSKWIAFAYCSVIFLIAFLIPVTQLIHWSIMTFDRIFSPEFLKLIYNSVFVAFIASSIIVFIALIVGNYTRLHKGIFPKVASRVITLGYSIPGAAIAIAVITIFVAFDGFMRSFSEYFNWNSAVVLRTTLVMLTSAYIIRFLAVGYNAIEAGFEKIGSSFTEASRGLGSSTLKTFFRVDIPMLRGAIFGGFILVFVDILKELPLTLFLQPFNFSTLATQAFRYANDEMVQEAALASILIIIVSAICIFYFHKVLDKEKS
ncbi:ABC transporter permease [Anaerobacillus isosaccharinicus]|uniref:Iron ABC transporter n=1 Tax=Anaerobacillus isosaccharinicus TaxID=1532552 RepID=A0A1S2MFQ3_9BACI|nr:iron ABC transporter permease [Anaerobacillus isosaccharinicus]MBA5588832.1 iron ABC transporter permease [Anaerobacillus isosaccharinicus]QOY37777.1 iron ABC transporter permease [Anaerobacillus isosaccharinicus]